MHCLYEAVPGYFFSYAHDPSRKVYGVDYQHLGFAPGIETWSHLWAHLDRDQSLTLLVLARHGQGFHNETEQKYGTSEWDRYWALQPGIGQTTLVDAQLTELGKKQVALTGRRVLLPMVQAIGYPHVFYCSPLRRCLETYIESWAQVFAEVRLEQATVHVTESCRETLGRHWCDKRLAHDEIVRQYGLHTRLPGPTTIEWSYDADMPNEDTLWAADHRETPEEIDTRLGRALDDLLGRGDRYVSLTCHSGVIASALRVLGHPEVLDLETGSVVFVVVKRRSA